MNIVAIIQARMSSNRLQGKVMKVVQGKTVLRHVIDRVAACRTVNNIVVASTNFDEDDLIETEAISAGALVYRGSLNNVLDRYYNAAIMSKADIIVRITSDCPLIDPSVIDALVEFFLHHPNKKIDYVRGNGFPLGINAEVFTFKSLQRCWEEASIEYEFEHVTPYIYTHPELFSVDFLENSQDISQLRLTLDTKEDWQLIQIIFNRLQTETGKIVKLNEILKLIDEEPELITINQHIRQKTLGE